MYFFFSSRRRHTRCALVTGVQTCALPIYRPSFDLKEPTDRAALGNFIVKAAQDLKSPLHFLRHAAIAERWQQHRANFWDRTGRQQGAHERINCDGLEQAHSDRCLIAMRQRQMVIPGYEGVFKARHKHQWVEMSDLTPHLTRNRV